MPVDAFGDPVTKYNEPARRFYLEERLRNLKMREDEGVEAFFCTRFVPAYEALADMGRTLDEETQVFLFLSALPDSWSGFVEFVCLLGLDMLSMDDVLLKAVCEELEGCHRADNRQVITRFGWDKYMQLGDLRVSGKMKDMTEELERLSKLSLTAKSIATPSGEGNPKSRKSSGLENKEASSSHEEPKGKSSSHGMQNSRSQLLGSGSRAQGHRMSNKDQISFLNRK